MRELRELNQGCLEVWSRLSVYLDPNSPLLVFFTTSSVAFRHCVLELVEEKNCVPLEDLSSVFGGANVFNDPLPTYVFVDLSNILNKYELLSPALAGPIIKKWHVALESLLVHYGHLEQVVLERLELTTRVRKLFRIPFGTHKEFEGKASFQISFSLPASGETLPHLRILSKVISDNFRPSKVPRKPSRANTISQPISRSNEVVILQRNAEYKQTHHRGHSEPGKAASLQENLSGKPNPRLSLQSSAGLMRDHPQASTTKRH